MLEFNRAGFGYSPRFFLDGLSFRLQPGARVLLCGPNGAGKTTLLRLMAGLLPVHCGSFAGPGRALFSGVQPAVYPQLTPRRNLEFWLNLAARLERRPPLPPRVIEQALKTFELDGLDREKTGNLSRGTAQRLELARICLTAAHTAAPCLILLDEPETGLEARHLARFRRHIAALPRAVVVWAGHTASDADTLVPAGQTGSAAGSADDAAAPSAPRPLFTHLLSLAENPARPGWFRAHLRPLSDDAQTSRVAAEAETEWGTRGMRGTRKEDAPRPRTGKTGGKAAKASVLPGLLLELLKKDLREAVSGGSCLQAGLLGLSLIFLFGMSAGSLPFRPDNALPAANALSTATTAPTQAALLCLASLLTAALVPPALYRSERHCLGPLLALGVSPAALWLGKALTCFALLPLCQAAYLAAALLFVEPALPAFAVPPAIISTAAPAASTPAQTVPAVLGGVALFNWGLSCLFALLAPLNRGYGRALPLLLIPLCAPLLLKGMDVFLQLCLPAAPALLTGPSAGLGRELLFLCGFDCLATAAALLLFPCLMEGSEL